MNLLPAFIVMVALASLPEILKYLLITPAAKIHRRRDTTFCV